MVSLEFVSKSNLSNSICIGEVWLNRIGMLTDGTLPSTQNGRLSGFIVAELQRLECAVLGGLQNIPLRKYIDYLLAHNERRILQYACWSDTIFRNGQFSIKKSFGEKKEPSFKGEL